MLTTVALGARAAARSARRTASRSSETATSSSGPLAARRGAATPNGVSLVSAADRPVEADDDAPGLARPPRCELALERRSPRRAPPRSGRDRARPERRAPPRAILRWRMPTCEGCGSCARGSRCRAGSPGGSRTSRRWRTCSPCASRTSRQRGRAEDALLDEVEQRAGRTGGYFFASETTRRRLELMSRSLASRSPRSMRLASSSSSPRVSSGSWRISLRNICSASVVTVAIVVVRVAQLVLDVGVAAVVGELDAARLDALVQLVAPARRRARPPARGPRGRRGSRSLSSRPARRGRRARPARRVRSPSCGGWPDLGAA